MDNDVAKAVQILIEAFNSGNKLLVCGNGGSASDADHIVTELVKSFKEKRPINPIEVQGLFFDCERFGNILGMKLDRGLPAISLNSQTPLITAIANDSGYEMIFAQQVYTYGKSGDVLFAISTSGQSDNVRMALEVAYFLGMKTILLTGNEPYSSSEIDLVITTNSNRTDLSQEEMTPIYHEICEKVESYFFHPSVF